MKITNKMIKALDYKLGIAEHIQDFVYYVQNENHTYAAFYQLEYLCASDKLAELLESMHDQEFIDFMNVTLVIEGVTP